MIFLLFRTSWFSIPRTWAKLPRNVKNCFMWHEYRHVSNMSIILPSLGIETWILDKLLTLLLLAWPLPGKNASWLWMAWFFAPMSYVPTIWNFIWRKCTNIASRIARNAVSVNLESFVELRGYTTVVHLQFSQSPRVCCTLRSYL